MTTVSRLVGVPAARTRQSTTVVRVRYAETDKMGVTYYANYFVWFEVARTDLLRTLGWTYRDLEAEGFLLPVVDASCEYLRPTRYDDELSIRTTATMSSPARLAFQYDVIGPDGFRAATGRTVHVAVRTEGRACRLPDRIRAAFL